MMNKERYHRQIILNGFGAAAQQRLSDAHVLVIGAGGLGCPALQYLVGAGVGQIGIIDDDSISLSNLHRQILYNTDDIGKLKVAVAAERLQLLNPEINIVAYPERLTKNNILNLIKAYNFILDGTDNFESRYLVNDACALLKKPLVFAAVSGFEGQLAVFNVAGEKNEATNYRDLFAVPPSAGEIPNCEANGVLGVLPGIIGSMAAAEMIKLIAGIGDPLINKLLHYNLLSHEQYVLNISPANNYSLPKTEQEFLAMDYNNNQASSESYCEIDVQKMQVLQQDPATILIDVREEHEYPMLDKSVYKQIPMSAFQAFLRTTIDEQNIVLICQHGIRSVAAAELLHRKYGGTKNIYSLKGGIAKWAGYF